MSKILVVGATGTIGRAIVKELADKGVEVKAGTRNPAEYGTSKGVEAVMLDLLNPKTFAHALKDVKTLFQLSPAGHADAYGLLAPFLEAASKKVSKIVTMTALGVGASDEIPLRRLELAVEATGLRYVHLRPSWFNQNFGSYWYDSIKDSGQIFLPAGDSRTSFIDTLDISAAAVAALLKDDVESKVWELTGPQALTYTEAAEILSQAGGRTITYQDIPAAQFHEGLLNAQMPKDYADLLIMLFEGVRAGVASKTTNAVEELTGRAPRTLRSYAQRESALFAE